MVHVPGHPPSLRFGGQSAHLQAINLQYTLTFFWLRPALYCDTAPVPVVNFVTGDKLVAPISTVPRHCSSAYLPTFYTGTNSRPLINIGDTRNTQQNLYPASFAKATEAKRRQKHAPNPPCTVTVLWPRWRGVPGFYPVLSSGYAY